MEHNERTYFTENEYDDVKGFTILSTDGNEYHIAEKWLASEANDNRSEDVWLDYWVPESDLQERVNAGFCEPKATLTEEQFEQVCRKVDWYTEQFESSQDGESAATA
jgi:hypothetical protein